MRPGWGLLGLTFGATATLGAYVARLYWLRSLPDQWDAVAAVATVVAAGAAIAGPHCS